MTTMLLESPIDAEREAARLRYRAIKKAQVTEPTKFGPTELPELPARSTRRFFSREGLLTFVRDLDEMERILNQYEVVTRLDKETGKYAVDIIPLENREEGAQQ